MSYKWVIERAVLRDPCHGDPPLPPPLKPPARLTMLALLARADASGVIPKDRTPSLTDLAEMTGLCRSSVKNTLGDLERGKWIIRNRPDPVDARSKGTATWYELRHPERKPGRPGDGLPNIGSRPGDGLPRSDESRHAVGQEMAYPTSAVGQEMARGRPGDGPIPISQTSQTNSSSSSAALADRLRRLGIDEEEEEIFIRWTKGSKRDGRGQPIAVPRRWLDAHTDGELANLITEWRQARISKTNVSGLPEWCGACGGGSPHARGNAVFRTDTGFPDGTPCPACNPAAPDFSPASREEPA